MVKRISGIVLALFMAATVEAQQPNPKGEQPPNPKGQQPPNPKGTQPPITNPTVPGPIQPKGTQNPNPPHVKDPQPKPSIAPPRRAQVVRTDPAKGIVVLQSGEGALAKEFQYRVNAQSRFWGPDRIPVNNGLGYGGFQAGAPVWYHLGEGENAQHIAEMRFYDPAQAERKIEPVATDIRGLVVRSDPEKISLVLQTPDGVKEFRIGEGCRFWDAKKVLIAEGLTYRGFTAGKTVWVRYGMGDNATNVMEVRFSDPTEPAEKDLNGQVVRADPSQNVFVVKTGVGEVEYRTAASTRYWDANKAPLAGGLRHASFQKGANIWFRLGMVENIKVVTEVRFYDPALPKINPDFRAQIARVDPDKKTMRVLEGAANLAKETEYNVSPDARFWDVDKAVIVEGLAYRGFRQGVPVWYRLGTGVNANVVTEVRFYNPEASGATVVAMPEPQDAPAYVPARIVRVDSVRGVVIVRTGEGATAKEFEYRVNNATRFWNAEQRAIDDGLRYRGFEPGTPIWYRLRTIDNAPYLSELRFYDPTVIKGKP